MVTVIWSTVEATRSGKSIRSYPDSVHSLVSAVRMTV